MRKQQLLKAHRQRKRLILWAFAGILGGLLGFAGLGWAFAWLIFGWIFHEAWLADHLFYSPQADYCHAFPEGTPTFTLHRQGDYLVGAEGVLESADTLILDISVKAQWLGYWFDPQVWIGSDRQDFERGVAGRRYLNLSGQQQALQQGTLRLKGRFCTLGDTATLYALSHPDYRQQRLMIIAPHADDAELAAFGVYCRASEVSIVTLTQGEVEAEDYRRLGLDRAAAAQLKGRLRCWDSLAIPLWGGVAQSQCVQLGYYCLQLSSMATQPDHSWGSRESGEMDIRAARQHNPLTLPADHDGRPTWHNLCGDLRQLLDHFKPEHIILPHPDLDPHPDHIAASQALLEALAQSCWQPNSLLLYANHLHDNDRWPMGPANQGIPLPPVMTPLAADALWSPYLDEAARLDKAQALAMHHDLQGRLSLKKRLRRCIQKYLLGRAWPNTGTDEYFRKAVRCHELFWVRPWPQSGSPRSDTR